MNVLFGGEDENFVTTQRVIATIDTNSDAVFSTINHGVTIEVAICTKFFNNVDLDLETLVFVDGEVLRADTYRNGTRSLLGYLRINFGNSVSKLNAASDDLDRKSVV